MRQVLSGYECIVANPGSSKAAVIFHGYGADFSDLAPLAEVIDPAGAWTWIFPNGPLKVDIGAHMMGRAWWPIDMAEYQLAMMTGKPRDLTQWASKEFVQCRNGLSFFMEDIAKEYDQVVIGGFSQGGMAASHILPSAGDKLAGLLLLSTVAVDVESLRQQLEAVPPVPFLQSHGQMDPILNMGQGKILFDLLQDQGFTGQWCEFRGGHEIPMPVLSQAQKFMKSL